MEKLLDTTVELDIKLFDEVVAEALNPSSPKNKLAEGILLKFKELPDSWMKIDKILRNSNAENSKFIALQILEETVKCKWVLFGEEMKAALRQYVFSFIIELVNNPAINSYTSIILNKFNGVLIEIVKKDWPKRWPTFISNLITTSQSTSMKVSNNSLVILKNINEQIFMVEEGITTVKKRILRAALEQEYYSIFQFISMILEYSQTQDVDDSLLSSCLKCFKSFCNSMNPEFIFSTRIVDFIITHLNSKHSTAALECLNEIALLKTQQLSENQIMKMNQIHFELIEFFKMYLGKFSPGEKPSNCYKNMDFEEKLFLKKYGIAFSSIYSNYLNIFENFQLVKEGLEYFVMISKIDEFELFREIFPTWAKIVNELYSEYPLRIPTSKPLNRTKYLPIMQSMLPVFVANMPRPQEVFIEINDLGEIVKNRNVETMEIEFYKKMKQNLFYLSFCIEEFMTSYFIKESEKIIPSKLQGTENAAQFDAVRVNKICWSIGCFANALSETAEREFFVLVLRNLLSMCEIQSSKPNKAIVASNIMFIAGQYERFLKFHSEFMFVVVRKLGEFMSEEFQGIKEMACDNFYKICEKCPTQFFLKKDKVYILDIILRLFVDLKTTKLDFYLQRVIIEGLLIVLKNSQKKDMHYIEIIYNSFTDKSVLHESFIPQIPSFNTEQLKMIIHVIEAYSIGFKILPDVFHQINIAFEFLSFYQNLSRLNDFKSKNIKTIMTALASFNESVVDSGYVQSEYLDRLCESVLLDYKATLDPSYLELARAIVMKVDDLDAKEIQRLQFFITNLIIPSIDLVLKADDNIELSEKYLLLLKTMIEKNFRVFFMLLIENPSYEIMINSILYSLTTVREISGLALETLILIFKKSREAQLYNFYNRFFFVTLENLLGVLFDKDMKQNFDLQIDLCFDLFTTLGSIPSLSQSGILNTTLTKQFIMDLFSKSFKNLTENSVKIFVDGLLFIKLKEPFKDHINDFIVKIYEFGDDEDIQEELELLNERAKI